jgi:hypothetical protein
MSSAPPHQSSPQNVSSPVLAGNFLVQTLAIMWCTTRTLLTEISANDCRRQILKHIRYACMSADCKRIKAGRSVPFNYKGKFVHTVEPHGSVGTRLGECSTLRPRHFITGKEPRYPFSRRLFGPQSGSGRFWRRDNHFLLWYSTPDRPARRHMYKGCSKRDRTC